MSPRTPSATTPTRFTALRSKTTRRVGLALSLVLIGTVAVSMPAPAAIPPGTTGELFTNVAVLGTNSIKIDRSTNVTGAVIANDPTPVLEEFNGEPSPDPEMLDDGFNLSIDRNVTVTGNIAGDVVRLDRDITVTGDVAYNELDDDGADAGTFTTPVELPVFEMLPPFEEADVRADPGDPGEQPFNIDVARNQTETLAPGEYGDIVIERDATLILTGGEYDIRSLHADLGVAISFEGPTDLKVEGRFDLDRNNTIGPANGSLGASDIVIYVGGSNGGDGSPDATPSAVQIDRNSFVDANVYAVRGTVSIDRDVALNGSVVARDVDIDRNVTIVVDTAYGNKAPTAVSQLVADDTEVRVAVGPASVPITLEASDPDGDALTLTLLSPPTNGTLGTIDGNVVEYTPTGPGPFDSSFTDEFTFKANDGELDSNVATVEIRGPEADANPPGVANIDAKDGQIETISDVAVEVELNAAAEAGIGDLTFAVVTPPPGGEGTLGPVVDIVPDPAGPIRSAAVTFNPGAFTGTTTFVFEACEQAASGNCDTGTVTIDVNDETPLAPPVISNVEAQLEEGGSALIDLQLGGAFTGTPPPPSAEEGRLGFGGVSARAPLPMSVTVSDEATFLALLTSSTTYDFEDPPFPDSASTNIGCIPSGDPGPLCPTPGDVYFQANTADRPAAPSPEQGMRGTNLPAPADGPAEIHFDVLTSQPNAFGFFADKGVNAPSDTIEVTINYTDESAETVVVDVSNTSTSSGGQLYFGFVNDDKTIYYLSLQGKNFAGGDTEFFIDDLTIGTGTESPPTTIDSTVAWNVADMVDDGDFLGDNANSGTGVPLFISATSNTTGGAGSQGNARVHIEYDIANLSGTIGQAEVTVHTSFGMSGLDTLDTTFYAASVDGDGAISVDDWETPATAIAGSVLPNQAGITSHTFDVTAQLQAAIDAGRSWFVIQGRVLEGDDLQSPPERGMQIKSNCPVTICPAADPPELTFSFAAEPDLVIDSLTRDPAAASAEDDITFTAVVKNIGAGPAGPSTLSFKIGGESPTDPNALFNVPSLAVGETYEAVRTLSLSAQNYQNTAVADFDNDVDESNEANNTAIDLYTVGEVRALVGTFRITSLPAKGTLLDSAGTQIGTLLTPLPYTLPDSMVTYQAGIPGQPGSGVLGQVYDFGFSATNNGGTSSAIGYIDMVATPIFTDECTKVGRPLGCTPTP